MTSKQYKESLTFARPIDVRNWRVGDQIRGCPGGERVVVHVGCGVVAMAPATWWRIAWYWLRRKAGL